MNGRLTLRVGLALVAMLMATTGLPQEEAGVRVLSESPAGIPTFLRGNLGNVGPVRSVAPRQRARWERTFAAGVRGYLRSFAAEHLSAAGSEDLLPRQMIRDALGRSHLRFEERIGGRRVYGAELVVHLDAGTGEVYAVNGEFAPGAPASLAGTSGTLASQDAIASALASVDGRDFYAMDDPELCYVIAPFGGEAVLVWRQLIGYESDDDPRLDHVFADAYTGALITRHPTIFTVKRWRTYDARNGSSLPGTLRCTNTELCGEAVAQTAHDNTGRTYDYYLQKFGRDSLDGAGFELRSTVHFQFRYNNAFWNGSQMVYGDGDGNLFAPLGNAFDVVGHELTHGVTQFESGLIYQNESGALNEALSDIFSAAMEAWADGGIGADTWKLGEDVFTPGVAGDALRYMNNPTADGSSYDYYPERYTGTQDNGGVHWNSGIANLAFYLLVEGGRHPRGKTSELVPAIGLAKAEQIFYRAQTTYLTPSSNFEAARHATAQAAMDLYGDVERDAVHLAWCAVGVPGCPAAPPPATGVLEKDVPHSGLSGARGDQRFFTMEVPLGAQNLSFRLSGGSGDADLYVRFGSPPTTAAYDCRPYLNGNNETCSFATPPAGTWHVMLHAYRDYSGASIVGTYELPPPVERLENGVPRTGLSGFRFDERFFEIEIPAGARNLSVQTWGGTGDGDLYVRYGARPTTTIYQCRPYRAANDESCFFPTPAEGTWHVMIRAYRDYAGVSLVARWDAGGATTIVIDDGDPGFELLLSPTGRAEWWHFVSGVGFGGDLVWTTNTWSRLDNYARWKPTLPTTGAYRVEAFIPEAHATTRQARYRIRASGVTHTRIVDQSSHAGQWVDLGTYVFDGATPGAEFVELGDVTGEVSNSLRVGFDAVRFIR